MTNELIKEHALEFFRQISKYLDENSVFNIERDLKEYQIKNRHLPEFKYQDTVERSVLKTYLLTNDIMFLKEGSNLTGDKLYQLTNNGKELLKRNKELYK
jgi:hypothetical protein